MSRYTPRWIVGNIAWFPTGAPWGIWQVEPETFHYLPADLQEETLDSIRAALLVLEGESVILSIQPPDDPVEVHDQMLGDLDPETHPTWEAAALEAFDYMSNNPAWTRRFYICVELKPPGASGKKGRWVKPQRIGEPSAAERDHATADARSIRAALGRHLSLTPVTRAETMWLWERAFRRGLLEPPLRQDPEPANELESLEADEAEAAGVGPLLEDLDRAIMKEGGDPHDSGRVRTGWSRYLPSRPRRYLKVTTFETVSFQSFLVLHRTPSWFSIAELLRVDRESYPVDWAIRIVSTPNERAFADVKRRIEHLVQQGDERAAEVKATGEYPTDLARAIGDTQELRDHLQATSDPELRATVVFCVYGPTAAEAERRAAELRGAFAPVDWRLERPTGGQLPLFVSMLPGSLRGQASLLMAEYRQHLLPDGAAKLGAFLGLDLGDRSGALFGLSATAGHSRRVMVNPAEAQRLGRSGSAMFIGASGEGKSVTAKILATAVVDQGGMVCGIDLTPGGEWVRWLQVQHGRTDVVRITEDPTLSIDPLRVFAKDPMAARRIALGFVMMITGANPQDDEGTSLKEAIDAAVDHPAPSMPLALEILKGMADRGVAGASQAYRHLNTFARRPASGQWLGALIFDPNRRVLDLGSLDAVIFHAPDLALPSREAMLSDNLNRNLLPEQLNGLAILYAVAAVQRAFILLDPNRFAVAILDEAHNYTATLPGQALIDEAVRKGRKENGCIWILSQHPGDVPPQLASQFEYRFLFGQPRNAGDEAATLMGLEADPDLRRLFEEGMRRKEVDLSVPPDPALCLMRDTRGRVGLVWVRPPQGVYAEAFETNPARMTRPAQLEEVC